MTLLVIGATGTLGRQIVFQALTKGYPVKCGVREVDPNGWLVRAPEVEIVYLDLRFPDTLPEALKNVTVIIDASTLRAEEELGTLKQIDLITKIALIKAAKKANIQRFIFLSIANIPRQYGFHPVFQTSFPFQGILPPPARFSPLHISPFFPHIVFRNR